MFKMENQLVVVVALLAASCVVDVAGFASLEGDLRAVTYNTALRDRSIDSQYNIPNNRLERREQIIQMLDNSDADVICLQEVWIGEDVQAIVDSVNTTFPYSFSKIHNKQGKLWNGYQGPNKGALCDYGHLADLTSCVLSSCTSAVTIEDYWTCMGTSCRDQYWAFMSNSTENCITCVTSALPNVGGILEWCGGDGLEDNFRKINSPGLVLLSREKIAYSTYNAFYPEKDMIVRGYLFAYVKGICLVCTQLSADLWPFYPEVYKQPVYGFKSYAEQNLHEALNLITTYGKLSQFLFIGDFNSGLSGDGINGTMEISYRALAAEFETQPVSECTVCDRNKNPYNMAIENYITDGFFGKGVEIRDVKRVYTQADASISYNGQTLPLSDHYGVEALITNKLD